MIIKVKNIIISGLYMLFGNGNHLVDVDYRKCIFWELRMVIHSQLDPCKVVKQLDQVG